METRFLLREKQIPTHWYNVIPDLPGPLAPVIHPGTLKPVTEADMLPLFPGALLEQEMSPERWIRIPDEVRDVYRLWRPTPLHRAHRLEAALKTPAHIYYKYEGVSPAGSHKPNTAVPQAFYNKQAGTRRIATETGAGQWGSSMAMACSMFGLACTVYMVRVSYQQKPYRKSMMHLWGAEVIPSPSDRTGSGRKILERDPRSPGSLGIAISEAVEDAASHDDTKYALGSVLNHVLLHQTVIGQEAKEQMKLAGEYPDVVIGCHGGGPEFLGAPVSLPGRQGGGARRSHPRHRARQLPVAHEGCLRLRLRRHRGGGAHLEDVHPRSRLRAARDPRGRVALPRRGAARVTARPCRLDRGAGRAAARLLRGRRAVLARGRDHPGAGVVARDPWSGGGGDPGQGGGEGKGDPLQSLGPRPRRHGGVRRLLRGATRGFRVSEREGAGVAPKAAEGGGIEVAPARIIGSFDRELAPGQTGC